MSLEEGYDEVNEESEEESKDEIYDDGKDKINFKDVQQEENEDSLEFDSSDFSERLKKTTV